MPIRPEDLMTGGALQSAVAASLLREREKQSELAPGDRLGPYRVVEELGRGGMAIVYRAERDDGEYQQQVALKWMQSTRLDGDGDGGAQALFRRERQALANLAHPHIARLLDGGRSEDGRPWFAMELIDGARIDDYCVGNALPWSQRLQLFLQVCSAVAFAHARGVIHRDIKPANVLVDNEGNAKLLDFGIAGLVDADDGGAANAFTPGFASPEQQRGEIVTVASDVYQLGRLLGSLLSADRNEQETLAENAATRIKADGVSAAADVSMAPQTADRDLRTVICKACSSDPERRYSTVDALAGDIQSYLAKRPVAARQRRFSYLLTRYAQRHPYALSATAIALIILGSVSLYFTLQLRNERDEAEYQAKQATTVLDFLRDDLLAAADPAAAPGRELTVRDALDLASSSAQSRFAEQPIVLGAIRTTLATLYDRLGRPAETEREARAAVELARVPGTSALQQLAARESLVTAFLANDELDQAQSTAEQLVTDYGALRGPRAHETLNTRIDLARIFQRKGEYSKAQEQLEAVQSDSIQSLGDSDPLTTTAMQEHASALQMLGRQEEALQLMQTAQRNRSDQYGPLHPATLSASHQLGVLLRHMSRNEDALLLLQQTLDDRRTVLGNHHPDTIATLNETATVLQEMQRFEDAEPLFKEALETRLDILGEEHLYTRNSMSNLGLLYSLWGKLEQAAPLYERALAVEERLIGHKHPDTIALMHNIAGLYRKQGRLDDALKMHQRALAGATSSDDLGPAAWQTGLFRAGYAITLQVAGKVDQAETELVEAATILDGSLGPDHPRSQRVHAMLDELRSARNGSTQ